MYRAVSALPNSERPFAPAAFIERVPNAEWSKAQQLLQGVVDAADRVKMTIDIFNGGRHGLVTQAQIQTGLKAQDSPTVNDEDDILDEAGGIREDVLLRLAQQVKK